MAVLRAGSPSVAMAGALSPVLALCAACGGNGDTDSEPAHSTWITQAEYQFDDAPEEEVFFSRPSVHADPARDRLFVLDWPNSQVTAWTPEGSLLLAVGRRGEGPGEFGTPQDLYVDADGTFSVRENLGARFTHFTADGELIETVRGLDPAVSYQGMGLSVTFPRDGTYLGRPLVPADVEVGTDGSPPFLRQPLLRVRRSEGGRWSDPEPLLWLDMRNSTHVLQVPNIGPAYTSQPFGDWDRVSLKPGTAMVMRMKEAPGAVELIEVSDAGDTVWHRRLQFEPRKLPPRMIEEAAQGVVGGLEGRFGMSSRDVHDAFMEGLYRPEHLPAVDGSPVLAASGEVWLKSFEVSDTDTLQAYYVLRRGDMEAAPRRVLVPEWLRVHDATGTHVWGVWRDSMDRPHVVGRRLVALSEAGEG